MSFCLGHYQLGRIIDAVVGAVPVNDHAVDSPADHVRDLIVDLPGVIRVIPDVHVIRTAEPKQQMGVNLRIRSRIKQRVYVDLADVCRAGIAVALVLERVRRAGIIRDLCRQGGCRYDGVCRHAHSCQRQEQDKNK